VDKKIEHALENSTNFSLIESKTCCLSYPKQCMCTVEYYSAIQISLNHVEKVDLVLKSIILTI